MQSEFPVRIELWGDDVDSIAYFDPETQRRTESAGEFRIAPAIETITDRAGLAEKIEGLAKSARGKKAEAVREKLFRDAQKLRDGSELECIDKYIPVIYDRLPSVFDYFSGLTVFSEYTKRGRAGQGSYFAV